MKGNIWPEVGPKLDKLIKELKYETTTSVDEANLTRLYDYPFKVVDSLLPVYQGIDYEGIKTRELLKSLREKHSHWLLEKMKGKEKAPLSEFSAAVEECKIVILKGLITEETLVNLISLILERLRSATMLTDARNPRVIQLSKENALLKQKEEQLTEQVEFLKKQAVFGRRQSQIQKELNEIFDSSISGSHKKKSLNLDVEQRDDSIFTKAEGKDPLDNFVKNKIISDMSLVSPNFGKNIAFFPPSKRASIFCSTTLNRRESLPTSVRSGPTINLLDKNVGDAVSAFDKDKIERENADLKLKVSELKQKLEDLASQNKEALEEKDHMIKMLHLEQEHSNDCLKKQLEAIKEIYRVEKQQLIKRLEEETDKSNHRMRELDTSWLHKTHVQTQESESRYGEMKASYENALESKSKQLEVVEEKLKDLKDHSRMQSVRYEGRIQDLKSDIRKLEAKIELLRRKLKDANGGKEASLSPAAKDSVASLKFSRLIDYPSDMFCKSKGELNTPEVQKTSENIATKGSLKGSFVQQIKNDSFYPYMFDSTGSPYGSSSKLDTLRDKYSVFKETPVRDSLDLRNNSLRKVNLNLSNQLKEEVNKISKPAKISFDAGVYSKATGSKPSSREKVTELDIPYSRIQFGMAAFAYDRGGSNNSSPKIKDSAKQPSRLQVEASRPSTQQLQRKYEIVGRAISKPLDYLSNKKRLSTKL